VQKLFSVIRALRQDGVGLVYISHRLEEVAAISDRVTVLRDGQTIATRNMAEVDRPELIRLMVGRDLSAVFPQREHPAAITNEFVLETRNLSSTQLRLTNISIAVKRGEILGIAGLVGSGRTELARMLFGLDQPDSGTVLLRGAEVELGSPADAIRHRIAYVPKTAASTASSSTCRSRPTSPWRASRPYPETAS
jgi:ABC-type sugar transport system ATPase subunit